MGRRRSCGLGAAGLVLVAVVGAVRYRRGRPARSAVPWMLACVSSVIRFAAVAVWALRSML